MSLVQYSSSSEDSDVEKEEEAKEVTSSIIDNKPEANQDITSSISSFLPPPKNRQPQRREPRVLGKAIRKVAGASEVNPDNIVLEKSSKQVTSFIPSSLRNKQRPSNSEPKATTPIVKNEASEPEKQTIEIFQQVKNKSKPIISRATKVEVRPVTDNDGAPETSEKTTTLVPGEPKKRTRDDEVPDDIKEFNVNDFYQKNMELKDQGLLEENKRLHTVTHSKNQLSALMKNAQQDEEVLNERIERSKRLKKEKGNKYGW